MKLSVLGLLAFVTFAFLTVSTVGAQETECPQIHIECVSPPGCCEPPLEFVVRIHGTRSSTPSYSWRVYGGRIISGDGTAAIRVVSNLGSTVTATVEIGGFDPRCPKSASATVHCDAALPVRLFDQYSSLSFTRERLRLDQFARQLKNEHTSRGFILVTGDRARAERAKRYLVTHHGFEADRIFAMSKKKKGAKLRTRLFVVPAGALPPSFARVGEHVPKQTGWRQIRYRGGLAL
jgi:hypothetical protein